MNVPSRFLVTMIYDKFIKPRSAGVDSRRREFVLNVLLFGLLLIASLASVIGLLHIIINQQNEHPASLVSSLFFWIVVSVLLLLSRRGKPKLVAYIFVGFLLFSGLQVALTWGFGMADAELLFALTIVVAGVLFTAPLALFGTLAVTIILVTVTLLQVTHTQSPQTYWQYQEYEFGDAIGFIAIFAIIGVVSWLSNRETDRSLRRASASEADLQKERDGLELKVASRTKELEELQLAKLLELQPFAEFGRIGAGLVHEIANPLTAATLNIEELNRQQQSELTRQVQRNLQSLERYLLAARKQIKRESQLQTFTVGSELRQIAKLLRHRALSAGVELRIEKIVNIKLYGDVVKFNQLIANLLANGIDASEHVTDPSQRVVHLSAAHSVDGLHIEITDHGTGIPDSLMPRLFEPFFSTKSASIRSGLGIGLALVKQYVESDFRGSVVVTSDPKDGTKFILHLRGQER